MKYLFTLSLAFVSLFLNAQNWSNPSSWPDGTVPLAGEQVLIPAGTTIFLDINPPPLAGIIIEGELIFLDGTNRTLEADWIMVSGGKLEIGTEGSPFASKAKITLTGADEDVMSMGMGGKFITVMHGGLLNLHGASASKISWTQLDANAYVGEDQITLKEPVNWQVGDRIVIAPSGVIPTEAEKVEITAVLGNQVWFTPALSFDHYGQIQTIDGIEIDQRAEVGLLSRNIIIQGDNTSAATNFGGHIMAMKMGGGDPGHMQIEGVELRRMGQLGKQARYPMHWHLCGDMPGDYVRDCSVHNSFHRGIVTHGTNYVKVSHNTIYDIVSHGFVVAEDKIEHHNEYRYNLGVLIKQIEDEADFAFPSHHLLGHSSHSEHRPGVFWIRNPPNILIGNHAAGSIEGIGFWYDETGMGYSELPDSFFVNNVSHSNFSTHFDDDVYAAQTRGHGLAVRIHHLPGNIPIVLENFLSYKNEISGAWLVREGEYLKNSILADNGWATAQYRGTLADTYIFGQTANTISSSDREIGGVRVPGENLSKEIKIENVSFYNLLGPAIQVDDSVMGPKARVSGLQFFNSATPSLENLNNAMPVTGMLRDEDGSLSGSPSLLFGTVYPTAYKGASCVENPVHKWSQCPIEDYNLFTVESNTNRAIGEAAVHHNAMGKLELFSIGKNREDNYDKYHYMPVGQLYELEWYTDIPLLPNEMTLTLEGEAAGWNAYKIPYHAGYDLEVSLEDGSALPLATSKADLVGSLVSKYYFDQGNGVIYLKLVLDASNGFQQKLLFKSDKSDKKIIDPHTYCDFVVAESKISGLHPELSGALDAGDQFAYSMGNAGDINGDGISDLVVGSFLDDDGYNDAGAVYVFFLQADGSISGSSKISATSGGFTAPLEDRDYFGWSVAGIGDIDADGIPDLAIGTRKDDDGEVDKGAVYILFMHADGTVKGHQKISDHEGNFNDKIHYSDSFGASVAGIGDLDLDGIPDIAVGSFTDKDRGHWRGSVWIIFLNADGTVKYSRQITSDTGGFTGDVQDEDRFGSCVGLIGDVNGDGIQDICVGAFGDDDGGMERGAVHVIFLKRNGKAKGQQKISARAGGFNAITELNEVFGVSCGGIGDFNEDGIPDLAVGAMRDNDGENSAGAVFLLMLNSAGEVIRTEKISATQGGFGGDLDKNDHFGSGLAVMKPTSPSGTLLLAIGAELDDDVADDAGAFYMTRLVNNDCLIPPTPRLAAIETTLQVTPNPAIEGNVSIDLNAAEGVQMKQLKIFDQTGKLIRSFEGGTGYIQFSISSLSPGLYTVMAEMENGELLRGQFIKQ